MFRIFAVYSSSWRTLIVVVYDECCVVIVARGVVTLFVENDDSSTTTSFESICLNFIGFIGFGRIIGFI